MKINVCDRCGKQYANVNPMQQAALPLYTIYKTGGYPIYTNEVDLCNECRKDFSRWLNKENEE